MMSVEYPQHLDYDRWYMSVSDALQWWMKGEGSVKSNDPSAANTHGRYGIAIRITQTSVSA